MLRTPFGSQGGWSLACWDNHTMGCSLGQKNPNNHHHRNKSLSEGNQGEINGKTYRQGCPVPLVLHLEWIGSEGNRCFPGEPKSWRRGPRLVSRSCGTTGVLQMNPCLLE